MSLEYKKFILESFVIDGSISDDIVDLIKKDVSKDKILLTEFEELKLKRKQEQVKTDVKPTSIEPVKVEPVEKTN